MHTRIGDLASPERPCTIPFGSEPWLVMTFSCNAKRRIGACLDSLLHGERCKPRNVEAHGHAASASTSTRSDLNHDHNECLRERGSQAKLDGLRGRLVERLIGRGLRLLLKLERDGGCSARRSSGSPGPAQNSCDHRRIVLCAGGHGVPVGVVVLAVGLARPLEGRGTLWSPRLWARTERQGAEEPRYDHAAGRHHRVVQEERHAEVARRCLDARSNWFRLREKRRFLSG